MPHPDCEGISKENSSKRTLNKKVKVKRGRSDEWQKQQNGQIGGGRREWSSWRRGSRLVEVVVSQVSIDLAIMFQSDIFDNSVCCSDCIEAREKGKVGAGLG